ncbi:MAG TPA: 30S ribosomal protein S21 [Candidatus Margulisiibacteriota bacterium]|nr:30S ribosomal protein S21 [Candidatus Margulisiibacteriota bacterium]
MAMIEPDRQQAERSERPRSESRRGEGGSYGRRGQALTVVVDDRGIEAALRVFKKLVLKEGLLKDIKRHEHYEKPGDRKRRKTREAIRRRRRQAARTRVRFGYPE